MELSNIIFSMCAREMGAIPRGANGPNHRNIDPSGTATNRRLDFHQDAYFLISVSQSNRAGVIHSRISVESEDKEIYFLVDFSHFGLLFGVLGLDTRNDLIVGR